MRKVSNLDKRKSYNCYSGGICLLLERKIPIITEEICFGLSQGFSFNFTVSETLSFMPVRKLHCLTDFIMDLGISVKHESFNSSYAFIQHIKEEIDKDNPVMIDYDGYFYPFSKTYNQKHEKRIGIIIGYDDNNLYISDLILGVYDYPITLEAFDMSVTSLDEKYKCSCYDVEIYGKPAEKITHELAIQSLRSTCFHFLKEGSITEQELVALKGVYAFAERLGQIYTDSCAQKIQVPWERIADEMRQYSVLVKHYGEFCKLLLNKGLLNWDVESVNTIKYNFESAAEDWQIIGNLFLKQHITHNPQNIQRLQKYIRKAAALMEKGFLLIENELD